MENKAISITQFNTYIKQIFDAEEMLSGISIYGEVSGLSVSRGIAYFSLKDESSCLSCVMFGADTRLNGVRDGDQVIVRGSPNYYVKGGRFNFNVTSIAPYGQGVLYQQFLQLKAKLEAEGLFDASRKKVVPQNPKRIGVVTSKTGAVIQDIINISSRRNPGVDIVLYPVKVQGADAEKDIANGIRFFSNYKDVDVVVVARGGGSLEDLQPFNTEIVARAVSECLKPIVSAVGHETDFTICDFVSDLRAPTPSAAAELLCEDIKQKKDIFVKTIKRLQYLSANFLSNTKNVIKTNSLKLVFMQEKMMDNQYKVLNSFVHKIKASVNEFYNEKQYFIGLLTSSLDKLNPNKILASGYTKIEQNGKVIMSKNEIDFNDELNIQLKDGLVKAKPIKQGDK